MRCVLAGMFVAFATSLIPTSARAEVTVSQMFRSHMVLQRDVAAPVWGWGDKPGDAVAIAIGAQKVETKVGPNGQWSVKLQPMPASADPATMTITSGTQKIEYTDVLVGDVYICSGQSNMEWSVKDSLNPEQEIAAANHPNLRLFHVAGHTTSVVPNSHLAGGEWRVCTPESIPFFSAVGYFYGRELLQQSQVPIGLNNSSWGGTRIEPWVSQAGFRGVPELKPLAEMVNAVDPSQPAGKETWKNYLNSVDQWTAASRTALNESRTLPAMPRRPGFDGAGDPCAIYNAMIHPVVPYAIRGAIWYQGESNGGEGVEYFHKMQALVQGWREVWQQELPIQFYYVQLANFQQATNDPAGGDGWARVRDAQTKAMSIPHTGMATIIDIGEANDIHPRNKQDVGKRLALWALRDVYGKHDLVVSGPQFKGVEFAGGKAVVRFEHVGGGLIVGKKQGLDPVVAVPDGKLQRFAIAGEDKQWRWADAVIEGETVVLSSKEVARPVAVRYAWSMNPDGANLYNKDGLPAVPFRSDEW